MAAPEDVVTVDAVCAFFALNGGRATNKELVAHFRNPSFDQRQKGEFPLAVICSEIGLELISCIGRFPVFRVFLFPPFYEFSCRFNPNCDIFLMLQSDLENY